MGSCGAGLRSIHFRRGSYAKFDMTSIPRCEPPWSIDYLTEIEPLLGPLSSGSSTSEAGGRPSCAREVRSPGGTRRTDRRVVERSPPMTCAPKPLYGVTNRRMAAHQST